MSLRSFARHLPEYLIRRMYFSLPRIEKWYQRYKIRRLAQQSAASAWDLSTLRRILDDHIPAGADLILHSSMAGLGPMASAAAVFNVFREMCEGRRTLLVPTHPRLRKGPDGILEYDPQRAPSTVGLISELARRCPEFLRSMHPYSSVAAWGPAARFYLEDNLNEHKPLPHGVYSPYARLASRAGFAVCLGVPFDKCLTMIHVSEETLDQTFPLQVLFDEVTIRVAHQGLWSAHLVRVRNRRLIPHVSMWSIKRDLTAIGAVRRVESAGLLLDIVDSARVVAFMRERASRDGYPYMFLPRRRNGI